MSLARMLASFICIENEVPVMTAKSNRAGSGEQTLSPIAPATVDEQRAVERVGDDIRQVFEEMEFGVEVDVTRMELQSVASRVDEIRGSLITAVREAMQLTAEKSGHNIYAPQAPEEITPSVLNRITTYQVDKSPTTRDRAAQAFLIHVGTEPHAKSLYLHNEFGLIEETIRQVDNLERCARMLREVETRLDKHHGFRLTLTLTPPDHIGKPEAVVSPYLKDKMRDDERLAYSDPLPEESVQTRLARTLGEIEGQLNTLQLSSVPR